MFFRNLMIYRLTQQMAFAAEALQEALAAKRARACASQELTTYGFTAPLGKGEDAPLVHASSGFLLIAARKEERILPGSVVRDELRAKIADIEAEQLRKVYKKERDRIKEDLIQTLLPRAFIRHGTTFAAIMPREGLIVVDTASSKKAEDLLSTLREAIGSLPVRPLGVKIAPSATLTGWVKTQQAAAGFHVLDECEMRDTHAEGGVIRCKRQDLTGEEFQPHLSTGKQVTQLSLAWQDKLSFVLDDNLAIKRLRFEDLLQEQAAQDGGDDELAQQDASFTLMMLTFAQFIPALVEAMGGEEIPQGLGEVPPRSTAALERRPEEQAHLIEAIDATLGDGEDDPFYAEAVQFVRQNNHASISAVQRHFKIGYNRAARLIECMQAEGIITAPNSHGAREVVGVAAQ